MTAAPDSPAPGVLKIHVPFAIRKHGGRKVIVSPEGQPVLASASRASPPLLKALARAFRWRKLLEGGDYATIDEIARAERVNPSYVSRVLRLTLLAPEIVEAILDARCTPQLQELFRDVPIAWQKQISVLAPATDGPGTSREADLTGPNPGRSSAPTGSPGGSPTRRNCGGGNRGTSV